MIAIRKLHSSRAKNMYNAAQGQNNQESNRKDQKFP